MVAKKTAKKVATKKVVVPKKKATKKVAPKRRDETVDICGQELNINFDKDTENLNIELAVKNGSPVINLERWVRQPQTAAQKRDDICNIKSKLLLTLHLHEVIEVKAVIDSLMLNATLLDRDYVTELMERYQETGSMKEPKGVKDEKN